MLSLLKFSLFAERPDAQVAGALRYAQAAFVCVARRLLQRVARALVCLGYRVEAYGLDRIPARGGALLVCNHVSYLDAVVIAGFCGRPVRFVMDHRLYQLPLLNGLCRLMGVIPIAPSKRRPDVLEAAYTRIADALESGEVVCLFPEGQLTHHGAINDFRPGVERIAARTPVPVVPMALRGLWGSFFSRSGGAAGRGGRLGGAPSRIGLIAGRPVPASRAQAPRLQQAVRQLRGRRR